MRITKPNSCIRRTLQKIQQSQKEKKLKPDLNKTDPQTSGANKHVRNEEVFETMEISRGYKLFGTHLHRWTFLSIIIRYKHKLTFDHV